MYYVRYVGKGGLKRLFSQLPQTIRSSTLHNSDPYQVIFRTIQVNSDFFEIKLVTLKLRMAGVSGSKLNIILKFCVLRIYKGESFYVSLD